ncbi:MAG: hypothetical protein KF784_02195 [Fimbriimonadaceae bacterium]|nr:hypothetical protein [Fimbriimonadaceae bacterium]
MFGLRATAVFCSLLFLLSGARSQDWPQTRAERTNFVETSHYADVIAFIKGLQAKGSPVSLVYMGKSTEGRDMPLVIAARPMVHSPAEAKASGKPIIYVQANIHAGEVEGKEAILQLLRKYSQEEKGLLDKVILLVTPIYNLDGNEKFGPIARNRPGQNGPDMVGVRPNGQGLDLNRDAIKAVSPEMSAVLQHVYNAYDPDVMMDLHTTDGTRHGIPMTYSPPLNPNTDPGVLKFTRDEMLPRIRKDLRAAHGADLFDYGNVENRDGKQAWYSFGPEGRYCTNYAGLRNRISVLMETTVYWPFKERVEWAEWFVDAVLQYIAKNDKRVVGISRAADKRMLDWGTNPSKAPELGVRFDFDQRGSEEIPLEKPREQGAPRPTGVPTELVKVKMPIYDRFKPSRTAKFPAAYIIPADQLQTVELLTKHGIVVEQLESEWSGSVEEFTIRTKAVAPSAFQNVRLTTLEGTFESAKFTAKKGDYIVSTAQPLGVLIFNMLEPESLDGAAAWGFMGDTLSEAQAFPFRKSFEKVIAPTHRVGI